MKEEKEPKEPQVSKEQPSSTKDTDQGDPSDGVVVSEEYQKQAHAVTNKANKHEIKHLRERTYDREDEIRKEEQEANKTKDGKEKPNAVVKFSTDEGPSGL